MDIVKCSFHYHSFCFISSDGLWPKNNYIMKVLNTPEQLPGGPQYELAINIAGKIECAYSNCYYSIALIDYYSKWPEVALHHTIACILLLLIQVYQYAQTILL